MNLIRHTWGTQGTREQLFSAFKAAGYHDVAPPFFRLRSGHQLFLRPSPQKQITSNKGTVFTGAGARWFGKKPESPGSPIEVIDWLKTRKAENKSMPGGYLCWELMGGNFNCRWYWGAPYGAPESAIPWCGLLWPDCTPVSYAEAEAVRGYATGEKQTLLFEGLQWTITK